MTITKRILCCGDRNWNNEERIYQALSLCLTDPPSDVTIIHGCCRGADEIAGRLASEEFGFKVLPFPADWSLGKAAGPIRNTQMLREGKPDMVLAFHNNIEESKGTKNMVTQARKTGIEVFVIKEN